MCRMRIYPACPDCRPFANNYSMYSPDLSRGIPLCTPPIYRGEFLCNLPQAMMRIRYVEPRFIVGVRVFLNVVGSRFIADRIRTRRRLDDNPEYQDDHK